MRLFFSFALLSVFTSFSAQETVSSYPFNPDATSDTFVGVSDVIETLAAYGSQFFPEEIMVGDTTLSNWIQILNQTLANQQAVIDSLQASLASQETQLDSTMIADMISAAGGLGSGGCNFAFPEGIDGTYLNLSVTNSSSYTIPEGKRLYITNTYVWDGGLMIDDMVIAERFNHSNGSTLQLPLIVDGGQVLSASTIYPAGINGFLVDPDSEITTVSITTNVTNPYIVPSGRRLYITNIHSWNTVLTIDDVEMSFMTNTPGFNGYGVSSLGLPLVATPGSVLATATNYPANLNGYLVDEDYFADCGGGGSSIASTGLDSATVATMINNAILQQLMLGDYYQGGVVAYLFQPGDAAYVAGEVHGYQAYYDDTSLGWGCEGVITAIGVNNTSIGQGPVNTQQLVNTCTESNFAAKWCNDLVIGGNSDWFLPNVSELMLLDGDALNTFDLGGVTCWTSEEATTGLNGCTGVNSCCYPIDFANTFYTNGSSWSIYQNRKMPGGGWVNGVNCSGWASSKVIAFRQF
jgi:hypothetical protein